jgi:hypothetical protein
VDKDKANGVNIHMVDTKGLDENSKKTFGEGPAYFAVRDDALIVVLGDNALSTIKEALGSKPKSGPQAKMAMSMRAFAPTLVQSGQYDKDTIDEALKEAFDKTNADQISLSIEGGSSLKVRFEMGAPIIKFIDSLQK